MNETLLNLSLLRAQFDKHFDDKNVLKYWFTKLLHSSCIMGIMGTYQSFGELAGAALESVFFENNQRLSTETKDEILGAFQGLPAYEDVLPALTMLKKKNIRVIAVSNSSLAMMTEQLTNASIIHLFDSYYSVDQVAQYKPFLNIYQSAARQERLAMEEVVMVAAHDWDLFGAQKAGLKTAYISRKGEIYNPYYLPANFKDSNLPDLIQQIIDAEELG